MSHRTLIHRKGELLRERTIAVGQWGGYQQYMRVCGYIEGFCPYCGKWSFFAEGRRDFNGAIFEPVTTERARRSALYVGTCRRGHYTLFTPHDSPDTARYKRDVANYNPPPTFDKRGVHALVTYLAWRVSFRKVDREAHFMRGHQCDEGCPEYGWSDDEGPTPSSKNGMKRHTPSSTPRMLLSYASNATANCSVSPSKPMATCTYSANPKLSPNVASPPKSEITLTDHAKHATRGARMPVDAMR